MKAINYACFKMEEKATRIVKRNYEIIKHYKIHYKR